MWRGFWCGQVIFSVSASTSKWKALKQMVNSMERVTGIPSCPFPHPGVTPFLDGGQQTANEPLNSAENMLDLIPARGDSKCKLEWKLWGCLLLALVVSENGQETFRGHNNPKQNKTIIILPSRNKSYKNEILSLYIQTSSETSLKRSNL